MKTEGELVQFFSDVLAKKLEGIEALRKESQTKYTIFLFAIPFILIGIVLYTGAKKPGDFMVPIVFFGPILLFLFLIISSSIKERYRTTFKKEIVGEMVKFYDKRLTYTPDKGIMPAAIRISELFYNVDEEGGSDYAEGQLGETYIQFSKICATDNHFSGIFMIAGFNKNFNGKYIVLPRKYAGVDSFFSKALRHFADDLPAPIVMENPDFEKEFAAFGVDEIETRYILTPSFMEKMLQFRNEAKNDLYISFTRSRMFLAFGTDPYDIFEPNLTSETTLEEIEQWGRTLQLAIGMVEEFGLNTRIWSKQ